MAGTVGTINRVGITQRDSKNGSRVSELQQINRMLNAAHPCGVSKRKLSTNL